MGEVARLARSWSTSEDAEDASASPARFEAFFGQEMDRLLRALSVITGSRAEAEDIAQDAFIKVLERWNDVGAMENPSGYLYRTAMNRMRNEYRRAAQALRRTIGIGVQRDVFEAVDARDVAVRALGRLTTRQRAALVLTEGLGFSGEEAGAILGIKASTVWALTHQARDALKDMREEGIDG
jgi:RNA polymerase sigma-70 factor (ECF subfamily)